MPQKHEKRKNIFKYFSLLSILGIGVIIALILVFIRPAYTKADSSMEINGNGVLVRYNIKDGVTQVSVPNNVRAIGNEAFMGDKTLERIYIPGSVKAIGAKAFYGCSRLMEINIQEGTEEIKDSAFAMCTGLQRVQLPSSLRSLGNGAFAGDGALDNFAIAEGNRSLFLNDNVIYDRNSTRIIEMVPGRQGESYDMPFTVKSIAPYAFWGAEHLKNVRVSNNVTAITPFAFTNATALEFIYLPNSVNSIQEYAFRDCKNLKTVASESSIGYIDKSAFDGKDIVVRDNVSRDTALKEHNSASSAESSKTKEKASASENKKKSSSKEEKTEGDEAGEKESGDGVENGGEIVFNTPWGVNAPYKEIDTSDPDLYGTGKIVGGRTIIMPAKKQDYSNISANKAD